MERFEVGRVEAPRRERQRLGATGSVLKAPQLHTATAIFVFAKDHSTFQAHVRKPHRSDVQVCLIEYVRFGEF